MEQAQMYFIRSQTRTMDQDTVKCTEWVHSEDWWDCTDMQVDEHLHHFMHITFVGFFISCSSWSSNKNG